MPVGRDRPSQLPWKISETPFEEGRNAGPRQLVVVLGTSPSMMLHYYIQVYIIATVFKTATRDSDHCAAVSRLARTLLPQNVPS